MNVTTTATTRERASSPPHNSTYLKLVTDLILRVQAMVVGDQYTRMHRREGTPALPVPHSVACDHPLTGLRSRSWRSHTCEMPTT
jgi:hypothetical protein